MEPCKRLIVALNVLNDEWAGGVALFGAFCMICVIAFFCILASDISQYVAVHSGVAWLSVALQMVWVAQLVVWLLMPFIVAGIPASLTNDCIALMEMLNDIRIHDMTLETDAKIVILERALGNVNGGQGKHVVHHSSNVHLSTVKR